MLYKTKHCFLNNSILRWLKIQLENTCHRTMSTTGDSIVQPDINTTHGEKRPILDDGNETEAKIQKIETVQRIKRKNYAVLLGYLGKDYYGMQRNPSMKTIEEDLVTALLKADLITAEHFENIRLINFQRAARTDKGVSAIRQIVSLKLPENPDKTVINKFLPDVIRVFGIKRVTKGFNSKNQCDAQSLNRLNSILKLMEGTHNFHNFTSKVKPLDPRAQRYIIKFHCVETFILDGMEFAILEIKGQSFMLHQIRKMIAVVIAVARNIIPEETINEAFKTMDKLEIPIAPGLGLCLCHVHYDYYGKRYGADGLHETLDWKECEEEVEKFQKEYILKHMVNTEISEQITLKWIAGLPFYSFNNKEEFIEDDEKLEAVDNNIMCDHIYVLSPCIPISLRIRIHRDDAHVLLRWVIPKLSQSCNNW
ncbi:pseudouridylate synthase 1 homolog isoform X3 [Polyergus mexicanus]|uniref:pseudouridylate synthase 1 homolog isoform X3 n=1 Tax=Polyergus mexicanus TaxID=615972 RepID=UPI0038B50772